MKSPSTAQITETVGPRLHTFNYCLAAALIIVVGVGVNIATCHAQPSEVDAAGAQVLTRGPVHEAFAGIVTFNPEPGVVVTKGPPAIIEEMPPEEKPEGDHVTWIPGYWAWDDERRDFLWVSGTWRALPPGREWMAGYWGRTPQGFQWTSGYWADTTVRETTYLPAPPATVEVGPNIAPPSLDYGWSPGSWVWYQSRYAWRPGYWVQGRADWDWTPAHYVWTPRGYIFVGGFWDYPVERRGILFAPVYFESGVYAVRGYSYSPTIVINLGVFSDHLFLRPRYCHYYFGDYYAPSYVQGGFYASFSFQTGRHGYDPIYSHQRWEHRQDREWERRTEIAYQNRRDHEGARPPRTWAAQRSMSPTATETKENRVMMATPIDQLAKGKDASVRLQPVTTQERQQLVQRGQEVQQSRDQRRALEAKAVDTTARKPGTVVEPARVQHPKSPIAARSAEQLRGNQAPPKPPQAPKPNLKVEPQSKKTDRQPNTDKVNPPPKQSEPESEKKPAPGQNGAVPRENQVKPELPPRANDADVKSSNDSRRSPEKSPTKAQTDSPPRPNVATAQDRENSPRIATIPESKAPRGPEQTPVRKSGASEKGAEKLLKLNSRQKSKPAPPDQPAMPQPNPRD